MALQMLSTCVTVEIQGILILSQSHTQSKNTWLETHAGLLDNPSLFSSMPKNDSPDLF